MNKTAVKESGRWLTSKKENERLKLYERGLNDAEISEKLGLHVSTIWSWRNRRNLPPLGRAGRVADTLDKMKLRPQSELTIILEDLDFSWVQEEITTAKQMWDEGKHIATIARHMQRDQDEVALLIMHLKRKGRLKNRTNGVFGE